LTGFILISKYCKVRFKSSCGLLDTAGCPWYDLYCVR